MSIGWPFTRIAASMLLVLPAPVFAATETVEYPLNTVRGLLASCTYEGADQAEIEYHFGTCIGYVKGVGNTAGVLEIAKGRRLEICLKSDTDNGELRDIVVAALKQWSKQDDNPAPIIIAAILRRFPCSPKTGTPPS